MRQHRLPPSGMLSKQVVDNRRLLHKIRRCTNFKRIPAEASRIARNWMWMGPLENPGQAGCRRGKGCRADRRRNAGARILKLSGQRTERNAWSSDQTICTIFLLWKSSRPSAFCRRRIRNDVRREGGLNLDIMATIDSVLAVIDGAIWARPSSRSSCWAASF